MRYHACIFLLLAVTGSVLFALSASKPPTGYLHSWNQISTLAHSRLIADYPETWKTPIDVVTRITWHPSDSRIAISESFSLDSIQAFRVYEEFPLYHILVAKLSRLTGSLENSARFLSILCMLSSALGLYALTLGFGSQRIASFSVLLFLSSFPILYYGQAVMSDMAMLQAGIWSMFCLSRFDATRKYRFLILGQFALMLSALFKSYGVFFVLPWFWCCIRLEERSIAYRLQFLALTACAVAPVLSWHLWAYLQPGHQEASSHLLSAKASAVSSLAFPKALFDAYFRYLGYAAGTLLVLCRILRSKQSKTQNSDWLLYAWIIASAVFLIFSADKLPDHNYYFLIAAPPFFIFTARALDEAVRKFSNKHYASLLLSVVLLTGLGLSAKDLTKALRPNPDVEACSKALRQAVPANSLVAIRTDAQRYNSIAYYSERYAVFVEDSAFDVLRYKNFGADYLLLNSSPEEVPLAEAWLSAHASQSIFRLDGLQDFKGRARVCSLYRL